MGEVYRAEDTKLGRAVALKVLPAEMASDPERLARFKREATTVAGLNHPNIVTLHSVDEADGVHFLTMELIEGRTLDKVIRKRAPRSSGSSTWPSRSPTRSPPPTPRGSCTAT